MDFRADVVESLVKKGGCCRVWVSTSTELHAKCSWVAALFQRHLSLPDNADARVSNRVASDCEIMSATATAETRLLFCLRFSHMTQAEAAGSSSTLRMAAKADTCGHGLSDSQGSLWF